jgi:hypothetical protein
MRPILCLDFDGVCHSYTSGWKGATVIPDAAVPGLFDFLVVADCQFQLEVFSSRSTRVGGIEAMIAWFKSEFLKMVPDGHCRLDGNAFLFEVQPESGDMPTWEVCVSFPKEKPPAFLTLDDRAITFNGTWPDPCKLAAFTPWYQSDNGGLKNECCKTKYEIS